jgi:hypothetical protein
MWTGQIFCYDCSSRSEVKASRLRQIPQKPQSEAQYLVADWGIESTIFLYQ